MQMMRRFFRNQWVRAIVIISIISFIFHARLFIPHLQLIATPEFELNDAIQLSYASKYWYWEKLHGLELPFWSTQMGAGFPVLGEGQTGILYLPNLVLYGVSPSAPLAYNLSLVLVTITAALGTYWWLSLLAVPWIVSVIGGLTFGCSGFFLFHLQHIALLQSFSLLPWLFAATHQLFKKQRLRDGIFFSILLSQQIFAGFMQAVFITAIGTTVYAFFLLKHSGKNKRGVFLLIYSYLMGILLAAPQLFPSIEFFNNIQNGSFNNSEYTTQFSFPPKSLVSFLSPFIIGNPKNGTYYSNTHDSGLLFWETNGFVGIIPLLLMSMVLFMKGTWKKIKSLVILGGISVLLMLGKYSPFYFIYDFFPFSLFRVPARFVILVSFMLITISTVGSQYANVIKKRWMLHIITICWIVNLISILPYWYSYHEWKTPKEIMEVPTAAANVPTGSIVYRYDPTRQHRKIYMQYGWTNPSQFTIFQNALRPNTNIFWGITTFDAYSGRSLKRKIIAEQFIQTDLSDSNEGIATISASVQKIFSLAGISTIISGKKIDSHNAYPLLNTITDTNSTLYVYQNPLYNKRASIASTSIPVTTISDIQKAVFDPSFHPENSVLIESTNKRSEAQKDESNSLTITTWGDQDIQIQTITKFDTVLVLQNTCYPGWHATIDGKETTIYPANITSMAIELPQGKHTIQFRYQPKTFYYGCLLMGFGITIISILLLLRKRSAFLRKIFSV